MPSIREYLIQITPNLNIAANVFVGLALTWLIVDLMIAYLQECKKNEKNETDRNHPSNKHR
jgi:hypothetical protein